MAALSVAAFALSPSAHATSLRDHGFTVLSEAGLDVDLVRRAAALCTSTLDDHLNCVSQLGIHPVDQAYSFNEICHRVRGRWDFRLPQEGAWAELGTAVEDVAVPIVQELAQLPRHPDDGGLPLSGTVVRAGRPRKRMSGAIVSRPGAVAQAFHVDASRSHLLGASLLSRHRLFNVFVPLVDIEEDSDGTQFWPRSHLHRGRARLLADAAERSGAVESDEAAMAAMEAPACPAGGMIIFDYRCLHRGLANELSRSRPVAYCVLSTGMARDNANFPERSLRAALDSMPEEPELARAVRAEIGASMAMDWDDVFADPACRENAQ